MHRIDMFVVYPAAGWSLLVSTLLVTEYIAINFPLSKNEVAGFRLFFRYTHISRSLFMYSSLILSIVNVAHTPRVAIVFRSKITNGFSE